MDEEIKKILDQQSQDLAEIKSQLTKIRRHFVWERVWSVIKILIIVVPLVVGYIVLWPLLQQALTQYQELTGSSLQKTTDAVSPDVIQQLLNQYQPK